jgi:Ser/Thr protein kinase RdoA (MazF antagonist)
MASDFANLTTAEQVETMMPVARSILDGYPLPQFELESINHEYNSTFKVTTTDGVRYALRINVNSKRNIENVRAEMAWVSSLQDVPGLTVPTPIPNSVGEFISVAWHPQLGREVLAVLFSWLDGTELGDEPTEEQLRATGRAIARMQRASTNFELPEGAALDSASDRFWGAGDNISGSAQIAELQKSKLAEALNRISVVVADLSESARPQIIHADVHPWNVMWDGRDVAVFDFDDCMLGLPVQDLSIALYYLDTPEQDEALLAGYCEVAPLPTYTESQMQALLLHRRIMLLNYLLESENPEHRDMLVDYLTETIKRVEKYLG